jgi:hypothetical protein
VFGRIVPVARVSGSTSVQILLQSNEGQAKTAPAVEE